MDSLYRLKNYEVADEYTMSMSDSYLFFALFGDDYPINTNGTVAAVLPLSFDRVEMLINDMESHKRGEHQMIDKMLFDSIIEHELSDYRALVKDYNDAKSEGKDMLYYATYRL